MSGRTVAFVTLGCKVNEYDTEAMRERFEQALWRTVPFEEEADVYVINTCTVTATGDSKSMKTIRRAAREHPGADIIVCGCLAQKDSARVCLPGVRLVIGAARRGEVVELYERARAQAEPLIVVESLKGAPFERLTVSRHEEKTRAVMKIQEGCDRYCAYCVIPYVRGPIRSMPLEDVRDEAARLAAAGYREIVLTGIHLASYGRETDGALTLLDAARAVCGTDGVLRVRLGSLEPVVVTPEFLSGLRDAGRIAPQFHLSLQSGSESVLRRMRRRYTPAEYAEAVALLRKSFPGCGVTTDVLTGFPGETEEEALETERFVERIAFSRIHVFPYSRRAGTLADRMPGQVPEAVKHERARRLIALGNKLERAFVSKMVGTEEDVLFETIGADGLCEGYTGNYVRVSAPGEPGDLRRVRITAAEGKAAVGEIID